MTKKALITLAYEFAEKKSIQKQRLQVKNSDAVI